MGRYTTWDLLCGRYPLAAKQTGGAPSVENYFITGAEAELDGFCAVRYTVPFCTTPTLAPPAIADLATDMAWYKMSWAQKGSVTLKKSIDDRIDAIKTGRFVIENSGGGSIDQSNWATVGNSYHSVFGPDDAIWWGVDSAQLQAAHDERGQVW